jgi:acetoin utilization deacetylase AcuC-like enzyme
MDRVRSIIRAQFPEIREKIIEDIPEQMTNPVKSKFHSSLIVAEDFRGNIRGFAILLYMADLKICYLDFLAVMPDSPTSGVGGSIYEKLREEAASLKTIGMFFECLTDEPANCNDDALVRQNAKRLAFYERYGAYPIINTSYELPVKKNDDCAPFLLYDNLGTNRYLSARELKKIYRAILDRKYNCPTEYVKMVVASVKEDPVKLRPPKYFLKEVKNPRLDNQDLRIQLFINSRHAIHHVMEVGYVESPVRVKSILKEIQKLGITVEGKVHEYPEKYILEIHDRRFVKYFKTVCAGLKPGKSVYPYVFPIRNETRPPKDLSVRAGYYCIDTFTPLNLNAYLAARWGVNCSLTAADSILNGNSIAYVLTRPPGHHAERFVFGGFCYFNNAAIAANYLSKYGKVAILDVDYHHGNGQQQIFYERSDVLTISIHGHPSFAYPYFSGFKEERGDGEGRGFNFNFPLKEEINGTEHRKAIEKALAIIRKYKPEYLIVPLGLDTSKGDPTGTWNLVPNDFSLNGKTIGKLALPTIIVQEGGYRNRELGINARQFLKGFYDGYIEASTGSI